MRTYCIKGSFGSSEMTIPQMCQTDCPVLTGNAEYNLEDATVPMFSCFVNSMYKAWDHLGDYSPILRTF